MTALYALQVSTGGAVFVGVGWLICRVADERRNGWMRHIERNDSQRVWR